MTQLLRISIAFVLFIIPLVWFRYVNANYHTTKSFFFYLVTGLCLFVITSSSTKLKWPKLGKLLTVTLIYITLFNFINPVIYGNWNYLIYPIKIISFCILAYYLYLHDFKLEDFLQKFFLPVTVVFSGMAIVALYDFFKVRFGEGTLDPWLIIGSFGNVNMMNEFFLLCVPLFFFWLRQKDKTPEIYKYILWTIWLFIFLYTRSRSAWIGLGLWFVWQAFHKFTKKELLSTLVAIILFVICLYLPSNEGSLLNEKAASSKERLGIYKSSIDLIIDRPMGIGVGTFTNEIIPYRFFQKEKHKEREYADQPHSELLKWTLQYGVLGIILILMSLGTIAWSIFKSKDQLLIGGFIVLLPQIAFQFPFENPATLVAIALYLAHWLGKIPSIELQKISILKKITFNILAVVFIIHSLAFFVSIYLVSRYPTDLDKLTLACDMYPLNLKACSFKANYQIRQSKPELAKKEMQDDVKNHYFAGDYMRVYPFYFTLMKNQPRLCESLLYYSAVYADQEFFEKADIDFCQKYKDNLKFSNPLEFRESYLKWLDENILR